MSSWELGAATFYLPLDRGSEEADLMRKSKEPCEHITQRSRGGIRRVLTYNFSPSWLPGSAGQLRGPTEPSGIFEINSAPGSLNKESWFLLFGTKRILISTEVFFMISPQPPPKKPSNNENISFFKMSRRIYVSME